VTHSCNPRSRGPPGAAHTATHAPLELMGMTPSRSHVASRHSGCRPPAAEPQGTSGTKSRPRPAHPPAQTASRAAQARCSRTAQAQRAAGWTARPPKSTAGGGPFEKCRLRISSFVRWLSSSSLPSSNPLREHLAGRGSMTNGGGGYKGAANPLAGTKNSGEWGWLGGNPTPAS
jgi:hypothetical protein